MCPDQSRAESQRAKSVPLHAAEHCNHFLHFLMTLFTCGFWIPNWIYAAVKCRRASLGRDKRATREHRRVRVEKLSAGQRQRPPHQAQRLAEI